MKEPSIIDDLARMRLRNRSRTIRRIALWVSWIAVLAAIAPALISLVPLTWWGIAWFAAAPIFGWVFIIIWILSVLIAGTEELIAIIAAAKAIGCFAVWAMWGFLPQGVAIVILTVLFLGIADDARCVNQMNRSRSY